MSSGHAGGAGASGSMSGGRKRLRTALAGRYTDAFSNVVSARSERKGGGRWDPRSPGCLFGAPGREIGEDPGARPLADDTFHGRPSGGGGAHPLFRAGEVVDVRCLLRPRSQPHEKVDDRGGVAAKSRPSAFAKMATSMLCVPTHPPKGTWVRAMRLRTHVCFTTTVASVVRVRTPESCESS